MEKNLEDLYKQWCKETKQDDDILVNGSIRKFLQWLEQPKPLEISKLAVDTKYRLPVTPSIVAVHVVDIPEFVKKLNEQYILIKK